MRVCDWIADFLYKQGVCRVHGLMGGGASGLNDGFIKHGRIGYVCYHHEQGAGHAAIGESKFTGKIAVVNPTTGCAGTNCATSVLNAWQDSVPVLFISGNVRLTTCSGYINQEREIRIRKYGVQEHHIVDTYFSMTKMSVFIRSADEVAYMLQKAIYIATSGRPGPVWIDIPSDIQTQPMPEEYETFQPPEQEFNVDIDIIQQVKNQLQNAQRPVVLAGYGIRQSNTVADFVNFIEKYQIPYVSTYGARDYTANDHALSMGAVGIRGSRAGNFVMQMADVLLVLGSSLNSSVVGYDPTQFSPASYRIMVDIDADEMQKGIIRLDQTVHLPLREFFGAML